MGHRIINGHAQIPTLMLIAKDASWRDRPGYAGAGDRRLDPWGARVAMRIARLARIEGRVQGVFFRDWTVAAGAGWE